MHPPGPGKALWPCRKNPALLLPHKRAVESCDQDVAWLWRAVHACPMQQPVVEEHHRARWGADIDRRWQLREWPLRYTAAAARHHAVGRGDYECPTILRPDLVKHEHCRQEQWRLWELECP